MDRSAIRGEAKEAKARMVTEEGHDVLTTLAKQFWGLSKGQDDHLGLCRHVQNHPVVFRADGIGHVQQTILICGPVCVDIADKLSAITP